MSEQGGTRARHPVKPWHLAALPAVIVANYAFLVLRHEGSHALVASAFGAEIAEFHLWPPRGGNLSWVTFRFPLGTSGLAVVLQAAAPYVLAGLMIAAGLGWSRRLPSGILRANVIVTLVLFPCTEICVNAAGYWFAPNDLYYVLGAWTAPLRWGVILASATGVAASAWVLARSLSPVERRDEALA